MYKSGNYEMCLIDMDFLFMSEQFSTQSVFTFFMSSTLDILVRTAC